MDEKQIREAFEQVAKQKNWNLAKGNCGWYVSAVTHEAWQGFLACYQHLGPQLKEAERYRFLRDDMELSVRDVFSSWSPHLNDGLDVAIDAALEQQKEKQQC